MDRLDTGPHLPEFHLTDHHGRPVTRDDVLGSAALFFFGFTHCRSICPRALHKLSTSLSALGQTHPLRAYYVTVDADRDDPATLRAYLEPAHPRFTGITGAKDELAVLRTAMRVFAARRPDPTDPAGYTFPHSSYAYLFDRDGGFLAHFGDAESAESIAGQIAARI